MRRIKTFMSLFLLVIFCVSTEVYAATYAGKVTVEVGKTVRVGLPGDNGYLMDTYGSGSAYWSRTGTKFIVTSQERSYCVIKGESIGTGTLSFTGGYTLGWSAEQLNFYWDVEVVEAGPVKTESINLNVDSKDIKPKEEFQLTATVKPSDATNKSVIWESDNEDVATVSNYGLVKGISLGSAHITCKAADGSGVETSCTISVTLGRFTLKTTEGAELTYEITDESAKNCKVYSSTIPTTVTKVTIPSSANGYHVTSIGDKVFYYKTGIESVTIPNTVISIGYSTFYACTKLKSIVIPTSIKSIGDDAFIGCNSLPVVDGLRYADTYLVGMVDKDMTSCSIKKGTRFIGDLAFSDCKSLTSVTLPNSVTSIGGHAFRYCSSLTSITIPNSVTSIGYGAFNGCSSLTSITIPNSVTSIGEYAFSFCSSLTSITIPNSVTSIGKCTFYNCSSLTSITIPNSVTGIGKDAFWRCDNLTSVNITDISAWCKMTSEDSWSNPLYYAHNLYLNGKLVKDLVIPYGIDSIGHQFKGCTSITSVTIPNSVTSIGSSAFENCTGLTSVAIPNSVTSIGVSAFSGCENLTSVNITDLSAWCKIQFESYMSNPLSYAHNLYLNGKLVKDLVIPNGVANINKFAFSGSTSLASLTIPNSVNSISSYAFYSCSGLTSIDISNGVKSIEGSAFDKCIGLTSVSIPRSVTEIGDIGYSPFRNCNLKEIRVDSENPVYDSREDCNAIIETATNKIVCGCQSTKIPKSVKTIGEDAYYQTSKDYKINNIVIPCNVEELEGWSLVSNCFESVTIGKGVKSMNKLFGGYAPKVIRSLIEYPNNDSLFTSDKYYAETEIVYVPKGTKSRYLASTSWSKFPNIVEANFVTDVTFANSSIEIAQGKSMQLTANITPADADNKELEWESSDEDVVMVTPTGKIIAMGVGTAYVYATAMDCGSTYGTCKVTVTDPTLITDITFDTTAATLSPGESLLLTPTITPANAKNQELEWTSSNEDVAMVTSNGKVVAMEKGTAVITATAKDGTGVSASCTITVKQKVKGITLNHSTYSIGMGESVTLIAAVSPEDSEDKSVTWKSSNEDILMVNKNGRVVCLGEGKATITATTNDGSNLSASCVFNCVPVGIEDAKQDDKKSVIHSVSGARRTTTRKGINIINGKKVLVK